MYVRFPYDVFCFLFPSSVLRAPMLAWIALTEGMIHSMRLLLGGILVVGFGVSPVWAQMRGSVRVLDIQPTTGVARVASGFGSMAGVRMTRFMEEGLEAPAAILAVTWEQTPGLAPVGAALQFDYRMDGESRVRTQSILLPPRARGPQTSRFVVPLTEATGRRVTAWRLRVMAGEVVMQEITSEAWR
jgi:hypothetical protein